MGLWGHLVSNLLSGLVGAVIGAVWTSHLQEKDRRARRLSAGRGLLAEMQANFRSLNDAPRYPKDHFPYACTVWSSQSPLIAELLDWKSLEAVAAAYRYAPTALADRDARMLLRASQFFCEAAGALSPLVLKAQELAESEPHRKQELEGVKNELKKLDETLQCRH
jgi:hypothetical protein